MKQSTYIGRPPRNTPIQAPPSNPTVTHRLRRVYQLGQLGVVSPPLTPPPRFGSAKSCSSRRWRTTPTAARSSQTRGPSPHSGRRTISTWGRQVSQDQLLFPHTCHTRCFIHFAYISPALFGGGGQVFLGDGRPRMPDVTDFMLGKEAPQACRRHVTWRHG